MKYYKDEINEDIIYMIAGAFSTHLEKAKERERRFLIWKCNMTIMD